LKPARRRELVCKVQKHYAVSERRACGLLAQYRSVQRYLSRKRPDDHLRLRLRELAGVRPRYGYRRLHVLLVREGVRIGADRVLRIYREEGLVLRSKRKPKRASQVRVPLAAPTAPGKRWCMDFMHDRLTDGRSYRTFNVLDVFSRECLGVFARFSFCSADVTALLDKLIEKHGTPEAITCDNGSEFASARFDAWAYTQGVAIDYIMPGKPVQNGYIESFNGKFRAECLSISWFDSIADAQVALDAWVRDYNGVRPHSSLANLAPLQYVAKVIGTSVANLISP
jgi:putative transposase